jgi:hypothetical protein
LPQDEDLIGKGKRQLIAHHRMAQGPSQEAKPSDTHQT